MELAGGETRHWGIAALGLLAAELEPVQLRYEGDWLLQALAAQLL